MPTVRYFDKQITSAVVLGIAALVTNSLSYLLLLDHSVPAGNIFLFCSAGALGVPGALASAAVGVVPEMLFSGEHFYGLRLLSLCVAIGFVGTRYPRVPSFAVTLALWAVVYAPLGYLMSGTSYNPEHFNGSALIFTATAETLFSMIAGALLLNTEIWGAITHRPRHVALSSLLIHFFAIASTVAMLGSMSVRLRGGMPAIGGGLEASFTNLLTMFGLCIALPSFLGWKLARRVSSDSREIIGLQSLANANAKTFSGLASDFWRRQSGENFRSMTVAPESAPTRVTSSSGNMPIPPGASGPGVRPDQGICALNRNGTITFMNRRFKSYAGISHNEVLGKNIESVGMTPAICKHLLQLIEDTFTRGPKVTELKLNQLPDKLRFFEIASLKPEELEGSSLKDGPDSVIVTMKDITERRAVESHLLQSQKLSSLGNLVSNIAHSFNNTLTAIIGLSSYARVAKDAARKEKALNDILAAATKAGELVRNLLDFTAGGPSHMKIEDFGTLLSSRLELLKKIAGENYEISFKVPEKPLGVECDTNLMMQVVTNLVMNSRDSYQGKSGSIEITLDTEEMEEGVSDVHVGARPGHFARLRVKDNGCGMSPETLSKAFDPLFTTKSSSGHAGLGLSMVHAIVRAHDGFLTMESYPERGTTVSLYFPVREIPAQDKGKERNVGAENNLPHANNNGHREKILVVEDEKSVRDLVASMLNHLGYEVTICSNGEEALETCVNHQFDLVLVDMIMPRMHGLDLVSKLRSADSNVKTLVMTGYGVTPETSAERCGVIPKPFDINTLAHAIRDALHPAVVSGAQNSPLSKGIIRSSEL
ncbi:MAG: response regulator [Deltaproteobacteria bacterium]|nr:response regulator [Deltaproteobacteria bacterium]